MPKLLTRLETQLSNLREYLLPKEGEFDPTGNYSDVAVTKAIAYRVLAHAEIESYLEERAKEVALKAAKSWKANQNSGRVLLSLLAFSGIPMESPPPSILPIQDSPKKNWPEKIYLDEKINKAVKVFYHNISKNHGIKEENLCQILLPIGFSPDKFYPTWLNDMSSFGEMRGQAAHGTSLNIRIAINPKDELNTVNNLLLGLKIIDAELEEIY